MNPDELLAAARHIQPIAAVVLDAHYESDGLPPLVAQCVKHCAAFAAHLIAAARPEPLTERWLQSLTGPAYGYNCASVQLGVLEFDFASDDGLPDTPGVLTGQSRDVRCVLKTRGDLLKLAAALNEPLTEPT